MDPLQYIFPYNAAPSLAETPEYLIMMPIQLILYMYFFFVTPRRNTVYNVDICEGLAVAVLNLVSLIQLRVFSPQSLLEYTAMANGRNRNRKSHGGEVTSKKLEGGSR